MGQGLYSSYIKCAECTCTSYWQLDALFPNCILLQLMQQPSQAQASNGF